MLKRIAQWMGLERDSESILKKFRLLEEIIGYSFSDYELLQEALRHRSFLNRNQDSELESNERLEFLGDAILDFVVTDFLFKTFSEENEGLLSQKKSVLVSRKVLGKICEEMELGKFLILNRGEEKTGGRKRLSNLANLFEALLGAIYLDGGIEPARQFVDKIVLSRHKEFLKTQSFFNYKSMLLEFAQAQGWGFPTYSVLEEKGPDHRKTFLVKAQVNNHHSAKGTGPNKKSAEQNAAKNALQNLAHEFPEVARRHGLKETVKDSE